MYRTRSLGHPGEYCNSVNTGAIKTAADLSNYFLEIKKTTTPNGIFSMKIHWNQLSQVAQQTGKLRQTPLTATQWMLEYIPAPHYIFIRRRDKVRQAVSLLFSHETKVWDAPAGQPPPPVPKSISYQRKKINYLIRRIEAEERCWQRFFEKNDLAPLTFWYEDFSKNIPGTLTQIADYMGVSLWRPVSQYDLPSRRHGSSFKKFWLLRYRLESFFADAAARLLRRQS